MTGHTQLISRQDFFYVCTVHVKEKAFATPIIDEAAIAAREKAKKDAEMEKVKQEVIEEKKRKEQEKKMKKTKAAKKDQSTEDEKDKSTASTTKQENSESKTVGWGPLHRRPHNI